MNVCVFIPEWYGNVNGWCGSVEGLEIMFSIDDECFMGMGSNV
jgi:hypothetical protein